MNERPGDGFASVLVKAMGDLGYGLVVATIDGRVLSVNNAWCEVIGLDGEEAMARPFGSSLALEERAASQERQRRRLEGGAADPPFETVIVRADGTRVPIEAGVRIVESEGEQLMLAFIRDITDRKEQESLLALYRTLFEEMPIGVAVWSAGEQSDDPADVWVVAGNETAAANVGRQRHEVVGRRVGDALPELLETEVPALYTEVLRTGRSVRAESVVYQPPGGERLVFDATLFHLPGGLVGSVFENVTERDRSDRERRHLLRRLAGAEDETRRRLAVDLHDQPVQYLTAVNLRLGRLKQQTAGTGLAPELEALEALTGAALDQLRQLLFALQPPGLADGGLDAAVRTYLTDVLASTLAVEVDIDDVSGVDPAVVTVAFRIVHEALANVHRHAAASRVEVTGRIVDDLLVLRIVDDGIGIPEAAHRPPMPGHLGLQSMRERAQALGGRCSVRSGEQGGTVVDVELPISDPAAG